MADEPHSKAGLVKAVGAESDGLYPMRLVTRLTGLNADTIRAWERRYGAVTPDRSAGNTRRFSPEDVRRLTLLHEAVERGHTIGAIAHLPTDELTQIVEDRSPPVDEGSDPPDQSFGRWRNAYLGAVARFEVRRAHELLTRAATLLDRRTFVYDVVLPVVQEVGRRWADGDVGIAQEHVVTRQLTSVLQVMLDAQYLPPGAPRILLTTPPHHRHEFGLLIAGLLALDRGVEPIHLGVDLPLEDVSWAVRMSRANALVMSVARDLGEEERQQLPKQLELVANWTPLWIGAPAGHALASRVPSARFFHDFEAFEEALAEL